MVGGFFHVDIAKLFCYSKSTSKSQTYIFYISFV